MKKLLLIITSIIYLNSFSGTFAKVYIWRVLPDTVYQGDSISIQFKFTPPDQTPYTPYALVQLIKPDLSYNEILWKDDWRLLYNFPKVKWYLSTTNDSVYVMRVKIPTNSDAGFLNITGGGGSFLPIFIKQKIVSSVKENKIIEVIKTQYFNLLGCELQYPPIGEIYLKIETYNDGSFSSKRIYQ